MAEITVVRFVAALITAALFVAMPGNKAWISLVFALGFSHYATALIYSRKQIAGIAWRPETYIPFVVLFIAGLILYFTKFPLVLYFGVHHVFNEVYLVHRSTQDESADFKWWRFTALLLNAFVYLALVRNYPKADVLPSQFLWIGIFVSALPFFYFAIRTTKTFVNLLESCSLEILSLILLACSFFVEVTFLQVVCYHFIFWILFPARKFWRTGGGALIGYGLITIAVNGIFLLISPLGWDPIRVDNHLFETQFRFWSHFHITLSFALSDAHPQWIRQWFRSQPKPLAV